MPIILAIFYLLYFWLARRRLDWALGLIIFALPFYEIRFSFLGVPWTILSGLIWTAILAWSTNLAERKWAGKISACPLALTWQFWRRIIFGREIILFLGFGATALLAAGIHTFHTPDQIHTSPSRLFCGMGVCWQCLVTVDGRPSHRACQTAAQPGMKIETGS